MHKSLLQYSIWSEFSINLGYLIRFLNGNPPYHLYGTANSSSSNYDGSIARPLLYVWEGAPLTIQVARISESDLEALGLANPNATFPVFDGHLRSVSIVFRQWNHPPPISILECGVLEKEINRWYKDKALLKSHMPIFTPKPGSFWEKEYSQICDPARNSACQNLTDEPDNSSFSLTFPRGLATRPHGYFGEGLICYINTGIEVQKFAINILGMSKSWLFIFWDFLRKVSL